MIDPDRQPAVAKRYHVKAYHTIAASGYGKVETFYRLDEATLTHAILKLTRARQPVVYVMSGHGEPSLSDTERVGYSQAKQALETQNYVVKALVLARHQRVPDDADVVILAGPRTELLEAEQAALTQFIDRGGNLLLMLDPGTMPQMTRFVATYGLTLGDDMIIEPNDMMKLVGGDYLMPTVVTYDPQHEIVKDFDNLMTIFPVVRSVAAQADLPPHHEGASPRVYQSRELGRNRFGNAGKRTTSHLRRGQ